MHTAGRLRHLQGEGIEAALVCLTLLARQAHAVSDLGV